MSTSASIGELLQNTRYALRMMRSNLGMTALAIILLALGIGANTAIFSLLDAILLKSLPVPDSDRLVVLNVQRPSAPRTPGPGRFSYPMLDDLARTSGQVLEGPFTWQLYTVAVGANTEQEATQAAFVSGSYFTTLHLSPRLGRLLTPTDNTETQAVAVISDGLWERRFDRNPGAIGQAIRVNGSPFVIVGVTPPGFFGVDVGAAPDLWLPIRTMTQASLPGVMLDRREAIWLPGMARIKPGFSPQQAADALVPIFNDVQRAAASPGAKLNPSRLELEPGSNGVSRLRQQFATPIVVIMILVVLILTIACANLANLQLARAIARTREVAVRVAIGANQGHLIRQLLTESVVLSGLGAIAGLLLARMSLRLLVTTLPAMHDLDVHLDARVLLFCAGIAMATALLFGLAPVWMMRRVDIASTLKDEMASMGATVRGGWARQALVIAQIALTIVLVFGASLFVHTLQNLRTTDTGLQTAQVLQLTVNAGQTGATDSQTTARFERMLDEVRKVPGVRAAAFSANELLSGRVSRMNIYPVGYQRAPGEDVFSVGVSVDADFFRTLGIPLQQGRAFTTQDTPTSQKVIVLNQAAADYFFKSDTPIGRSVGIGGKPEFTVIGVVGNTKFRDLREPMSRIVYLPLSQNIGGSARTLYVSTNGDPTAVTGGLRQAIQSTAADALIYRVKRFSDQIDDSLAQERVTAWLSTFFGLLALTIATLGLYGLMAYSVSRRTREIGVRTALGASPESVVRMIFRQGMVMAGIGAVVGIVVAIALGQMLGSLLYGVTARDPIAILTSAAVLLITAAIANYLPARRAAAIDPLKALRTER